MHPSVSHTQTPPTSCWSSFNSDYCKRLLKIAPEFEIIFAVDGNELESVLSENGFQAIQTDPKHASGTDRIYEANKTLKRSKIINVQADEPMVSGEHIISLKEALNRHDSAPMATLAVPFNNKEDFADKKSG